MENRHKELSANTKKTKESYLTPTLTKHNNLRKITKDDLVFSFSGDVDVPPPPSPFG